MDIPHLALAVIGGIGMLAIFVGLAQRRRSAEEFQSRLAQYGVLDGTATAGQPPPAEFRGGLGRVFQPAADRLAQRGAEKGRPTPTEPLAKAHLKLRTLQDLLVQSGIVG